MVAPDRRAATGRGQWADVDTLRYKAAGSAPFRDITRQLLFDDPQLACQLRYFEVAAGGFSTLERHEHLHAVMILNGRGHCLIGDTVHAVAERDLIRIGPLQWHQFRADQGEPLGFLCMVNAVRDRPQLPSAQELAALESNPSVAAFLRADG